MSRIVLPNVVVGNDFVVPQPKLQVASPAVSSHQITVTAAPSVLEKIDLRLDDPVRSKSLPAKVMDFAHRYSLGVFAALFLLVAASAIQVAGAYWSAQITLAAPSTSAIRVPATPAKGPNTVVIKSELDTKLAAIAAQPLTIAMGEKTATISQDTIKSWVQVVTDSKKGVSYLHVNEAAITKSLKDAANPYVKTPINQVTVTNPDGSSRVIAGGRNGTTLGDITPLAQQIGQGLLSAKGFQLNAPLTTQAFAAVTPASFDKMIEINVTTKQMYLYEKGQVTHTYPISAGAPATPTPLGQYKIYSKLTVQDMKGYNADGTKYFQPHVRWINYFLPGGYAIHGNYWRPQSWFGAINSSHGCASLPDAQAKEVYDWAPLGTTVITHA